MTWRKDFPTYIVDHSVSNPNLTLVALNPPLIHGDLKSPNVMLTHKGTPTCKIIDFGSTTELTEQRNCGPKAPHFFCLFD